MCPVILFVVPYFIAVGALFTLVISRLVGRFQADRGAGAARASRLIAMIATFIPSLCFIRAVFHAPEYLQAVFYLPVTAGCWLVAIRLERQSGPSQPSEMGLNPHRSDQAL